MPSTSSSLRKMTLPSPALTSTPERNAKSTLSPLAHALSTPSPTATTDPSLNDWSPLFAEVESSTPPAVVLTTDSGSTTTLPLAATSCDTSSSTGVTDADASARRGAAAA
eukprot:CAMPEP_0119161898 /NCGR_PEP_ID=MMETSP1315-20130426/1822_1 /TAXON_ID=676789 /ORGANISM="Prasinoderma singularis, Strain RCC927" /LENGTH=109 /DNA_ID=CAMNT_0007154703 /DNA_START=41 /DNA_END=367 /DNA_ORIENTATION=+